MILNLPYNFFNPRHKGINVLIEFCIIVLLIHAFKCNSNLFVVSENHKLFITQVLEKQYSRKNSYSVDSLYPEW